jgi:hypothetical protein
MGVTIEAQVGRLDLAVEELAECVASLREDLFLRKVDRWSARDMVAHLIGWNRYIMEGSRQIRRGELPFYDVDPGENYSKVNAVLIREYSSTDRQLLLDELEASARELGRFLLSLDAAEWGRDYGVRHKEEIVTIQSTVDDLIRDYAHHTRQIADWAEGTVDP